MKITYTSYIFIINAYNKNIRIFKYLELYL